MNHINQSPLSRLGMWISVILPWLLIGWLVKTSINGDMGWLLLFVLLAILVPLVVMANIVAVVFFKGKAAVRQIRDFAGRQEAKSKPIESLNYQDLPWWDYRRYL